MKERRFFAGFDGGGSKTVCALCDENGRVLGFGSGGASNYRYCGEEVARQSMRDALNGAFSSAGLAPARLDTAYVSSATIPTYGGEGYVPFFASCVDSERVLCEGDVYPLWYGACGDAPGLVLIAGTGSVCYLFRDKTTLRAGGWGPQIGDEGSGYDIGLAAMKTVMRMYDHREEEDAAFCAEILNHYQIHEPRALIGAAKGDRAVIASCARTVMSLAEKGNAAACRLTGHAADELALLVTAVLSRDEHSDRLPLALYGGLLSRDTPVRRALLGKIDAGCERIAKVLFDIPAPEIVCAALALKNAGLKNAADALLRRAREGNPC